MSIYHTWKNIKSAYNNNKFKTSAPTWNDKSDFPNGSCSIFVIYVNKIRNRIVFKIKTGYKLELLTKETMKLLEITKQVIDKDKNSENFPKSKSIEVA